MRRAILGGLVLGFLALPLIAEIPFADERQLALWILRRGGQVMLDGVENPIGDPFDLPDRDFRIVVVDLHGTAARTALYALAFGSRSIRRLRTPQTKKRTGMNSGPRKG